MRDFRAGVNDPSREAAKIERNMFLNQVVKKKK